DPVEQLERLQNRTSRWILSGLDDSSDWSAEATAFDQHRLTILLRLVDTESSPTSDSASPLAARVQQSILVLLEKLERGADPALHRVLCAALARSFDAAVRDAILRASDLVLVVAMMLGDHDTIAMIAEASTTPDVAAPLRSLAAFLSPEADPDDGSMKAALLGEAPL